MTHFGEHVTIDGYAGNEKFLNDKTYVLACLNELPERLGMSKLSQPEIYFAEGNDAKDPGGWSGFVVIAESHISVHTFPARRFISADVYTCKNGMDTALIERYFREKFELQDIEVQFLKRGTRYPSHNLS
ncbi:MAG: S-adenosylmethionine decarboxylase [Candidatus Paceibacterota bacterium]